MESYTEKLINECNENLKNLSIYHKLQVPTGIRYISQWKEFKLPEEPHIMDKNIPGCGFTEWCLTNNQDLVLCSPRRVLLQNKSEQHPEIFLVKTILDRDKNIDKDISKIPVIKSSIDINQKIFSTNEFINNLKEKSSIEYKTSYDKISNELGSYINSRKSQNQPIKILVTYDSFGIVKEVLRYFGILDNFQIVIDEFQSIFTDSRFKSDTELTLLEQLKDIQKVCYLSATPMMRYYLEMIDEFKNLPYYELDWETLDPGRVIRPALKVRVIKSIVSKAKEIIDSYILGEFEKAIMKDGSVKESKEAVFFVNSVINICNIIKRSQLEPEQCCIICSNTENNRERIHKSLGKKFNIEKVPGKNEPRKMFTFCTRTVYLGADFYSDNARTFILSDANVETLAVDISLDLPQIMGRQRLDENPWRNEAEFYYKSLTDKNKKKVTEQTFKDLINDKIACTKKLLGAYKSAYTDNKDNGIELAKRYKDFTKAFNYKKDYVAVDRDGSNNLTPVINRLVIIAEFRAFQIQQVDYSDRFSVFRAIDKSTMSKESANELNKELKAFYEKYNSIKNNTIEVLKLYCESGLSVAAKARIYDSFSSRIKSYLSLGEEVIKSVKYYPCELDILLDKEYYNDDSPTLYDDIHANYKVGDILEKSKLKNDLQGLYNKHKMHSRAKATDIGEWFTYKSHKIKDSKTGKRVNGIELLSEINFNKKK